MRYETLAELQAGVAAARKARAEELPYVVLDNDDACVYQDDDCVFRSDPYQLLRYALDLLGIPHEEA